MNKLKESLRSQLTKKQLVLVPTSFDVVGNIAIFNDFPKELKNKEKVIAQKLMELNNHIKTVAKKAAHYKGRLRTPKIMIIAGARKKVTTHKESGCSFTLDIEKCYFSARSSTERLRIAKKVKKNETVLVMFSGIAPLPIILAKHTKAKKIVAIELSKTAHKYAQQNIKQNKVNNVQLHQGNVQQVVPMLRKKFDRVIMPLPKSADDYVVLARKALKPKGMIHLYRFLQEQEIKQEKKQYKQWFSTVKAVKAGKFSPSVFRVCLDLKR